MADIAKYDEDMEYGMNIAAWSNFLARAFALVLDAGTAWYIAEAA